MKLILSVSIFALLATVVSAADLDFCGYVRLGDGDVLFAFKDPVAKVSSRWMKAGQQWRGWSLGRFDLHSESIETTFRQNKRWLFLAPISGDASISVPSFEGGNFIMSDGTVIYSHDVVLQLGKLKVSSPAGVMVANSSAEQVSGDLQVETPNGTFSTTEASIHLVDGHPDLIAKTMIFQSNKSQTDLTSR